MTLSFLSELCSLYLGMVSKLYFLRYVYKIFFLQSNKSWSSADLDPVPSLYVCECVELELALKITATEDEGPMDSDFSCPIRLHRGKLI